MFYDAYCDTRCPRMYLEARRLDAYCVTVPTYFDSGHLFYVYPKLFSMENMVKENAILKEKIAELKEQLRHVIDHTIENGKRLLQYSDQIFCCELITVYHDISCVSRNTVVWYESAGCGDVTSGSEWTVQRGKGRPHKRNNRFKALKTDNKEASSATCLTELSLPFRILKMNGNGHGPDNAVLVQNMVTGGTTVEGTCSREQCWVLGTRQVHFLQCQHMD
ncbi:hypothetical protein J6590_051313 [Homalodisca vitripennis]|nr:hypothetical protein J6590_051313 [Homalodisca vitripennis]